MAKKKQVERLPLSGDRLIDWEFKRLVHILENVIEFVRKKKGLRSPKDRRMKLWGFLTEDYIVYLSSEKRSKPPIVKILIHETLHALYPPSVVRHRYIYQKADILWVRFTDAQKRYLRAFIPKHEVKTDPPSENKTKTA